MSLLCYCMIEQGGSVRLPATGVLAASLRTVEVPPVEIVVSEWPSSEPSGKEDAVERALEFHRVIQEIFQQVQLIQLRFPTIVESEAALRTSITPRAATCGEALQRFRDLVQMEIRLRAGVKAPAASGTEYLQNRQAQMYAVEQSGDKLREAAGSLVLEWRQRWSSSGMRCYALVPRERVADFRRALEAVSDGLTQRRLSGPWPPAEFMGEL